MTMNTNKNALLALLGAVAATLSTTQAELFTYTDGNLILGFQATAGTGSTKNVFFNLGPATGFRDNGNQPNLGNIGVTLASVYGNNWYAREDLYFGVIANLNQQPAPGQASFGTRTPVNGDPSRTLYLSSAAASPGAGALFPANSYAPASLGAGGTTLTGLEKVLTPSTDGTGWISGSPDPLAQGLQKELDGAGVLNETLAQHAVAWNNSWTKWNPTPGAAFEAFTGGIQQNFGKGGSATYVDVQRVLSTNTGAVPTGVVGGGTYETTISISSSGAIAALTAAPASPYDTWINSYPSLVLAADKLPTADPDGDGFNNLEEFAFGGTPNVLADKGTYLPQTVDANADSMPDLSLTIEARTGATFAASGNKLTATVDGITYRIEGSTDLIDWNSPVSEVTQLGAGTPSAGYGFKSFRLNAASGLTDKGFLRAVLVK